MGRALDADPASEHAETPREAGDIRGVRRDGGEAPADSEYAAGVEDRISRRGIAEAKALGLKLGVASSSPRAWVGGHLERLGLIHNFHTVRCRDDADVLVGKPDPAVYLAAMRDLDVAAGEAIALEDSPRGVEAARRAGVFTIAVPNGVTRRMGDAGADLTLDSMADMTLEQLIRAAGARE